MSIVTLPTPVARSPLAAITRQCAHQHRDVEMRHAFAPRDRFLRETVVKRLVERERMSPQLRAPSAGDSGDKRQVAARGNVFTR
jgi:hypothetical protein